MPSSHMPWSRSATGGLASMVSRPKPRSERSRNGSRAAMTNSTSPAAAQANVTVVGSRWARRSTASQRGHRATVEGARAGMVWNSPQSGHSRKWPALVAGVSAGRLAVGPWGVLCIQPM